MKRLSVIGVFAVGACTTTFMFGRIEPDSPPPSNEESVIVLGISPRNYAVNIFPGKLAKGVFQPSALSGAAISGPPKDGYVVAKVAAEQVLALTKSTRLAQPGEALSPTFGACDGAKTIAFVVPRGKVIYLADIEYQTESGGRVRMHYVPNVVKARQYLDKNYPRLAGRLEQGEYVFVPTTEPCKNTIYLAPRY